MPVNQKAVPGDGSITTTWQPPAAPAAGVDGYGIFVYDAIGYTGKSAWVCATCTSATLSGLTNGVSYFAVMYAHNANGWGALSASPEVTAGTPGLAANVAASGSNGVASVTWAPAPSDGRPVVVYAAFAYNSAGYTGRSAWVCGTCTSASIDGLPAGDTYTVLVYAYNAVGWGLPAYSNAIRL